MKISCIYREISDNRQMLQWQVLGIQVFII
uniref:Uncharacterized protein n=1 Tax=Anguilla anguilla TaxID=7936 RepID=A0A0E9RF54_ANGAN